MSSRFALWAFVAWLGVTVMWWVLAFAPLPAPPEWLEAARSVCFGTQPNGLPEAWGWATLIASPLAMLGFLLGVGGIALMGEVDLPEGFAAPRAELEAAWLPGVLLLVVSLAAALWPAARAARMSPALALRGGGV